MTFECNDFCLLKFENFPKFKTYFKALLKPTSDNRLFPHRNANRGAMCHGHSHRLETLFVAFIREIQRPFVDVRQRGPNRLVELGHAGVAFCGV